MKAALKSKKLVLILFILLFVLIPVEKASAIEGTAYTYGVSADGGTYMRMQDAYIPVGATLANIGLNAPEDLFWRDGALYIADSGNGRIVKYIPSTGEYAAFGEGELKRPTDVVVLKDGRVAVADYDAGQIVVFENSIGGAVLSRIGRPEDVLYGASPYKPRKIAADSYGNLFVISEGTHEGILQFGVDGAFAGFFGANKTKGLNFVEWFQKTFYTDEQKAKLFFRNPPNIVSLTASDKDLVYTVTQNDNNDAIKKLNLAGVDVLPYSGEMLGENNYADVTVTNDGFIFAVTSTGSIEMFDDDGLLNLMFGGRAAGSERSGLLSVASAIAVDDEYNIYVIDKERGLLQTFYPTEFSALLHEANNAYNNGDYGRSLTAWREILRMNPTTLIANLGYGKCLFQLGDFKHAPEYFKLTRNFSYYSDSAWENRTAWMRTNMRTLIIVFVSAAAVLLVVGLIRKKHDFLAPAKKNWNILLANNRWLKDALVVPLKMIRRPIDCVYDLKHGRDGSIGSAGFLYFAAFIMSFASRMLTSFIFGGGIGYRMNPLILALTTILPFALFITGSYLISSINDGEGRLRDMYVATAYALTPYIIFTPVMIALSHFLTLSESFIFLFGNVLIIGYAAVLVFLVVKEIHCYTIFRAVANILLTAAFMIIAVLALIVLFILYRQLLNFAASLLEEVRYRVLS
ncbi:hypothetical protein FACS189490_11830 [Clostridia bacterium]|nr:hypothetical protein FACS189490_11830 [Clostridia bacterium]